MAAQTAPVLRLGERTFDITRRALVMGILNRTQDSFYDRGAHFHLERLLRRADELVAQGADVLEVGARPGGVGTRPVTAGEEAELATTSLAELRRRFDLPLAVDTRRASVAEAAFAEGAVLANDMSGFSDPRYLPAAAAAGAAVVATHIRLPPGVPDPSPVYDDAVADVRAELLALAARAERCGLPAERIVVDPGLDLGKTWQQSLELLAAFDSFAALGYPVMLAASNKIFLGRALGLSESERGYATVAACTWAAARGARLLRVHDATGARHAADLVAALLSAEP